MSSVVGSTPCAITTLPAGAALADDTTSIATTVAAAIFHTIMRSLLDDRFGRFEWLTLGAARRRVKVRQRLVARGDEPQRLSLARPLEKTPDRRAGLEPEPLHDIGAPEQRRRVEAGRLLFPAAQQIADQHCAAPDRAGRDTRDRRGVDQHEQEQIARVLTQVAIEAVARPRGHAAGCRQVHGAQMVPQEPLEYTDGAGRQLESRADGPGALGADHVVLEEADASVDHAPRLRLGGVMQQRGVLQDTPGAYVG